MCSYYWLYPVTWVLSRNTASQQIELSVFLQALKSEYIYKFHLHSSLLGISWGSPTVMAPLIFKLLGGSNTPKPNSHHLLRGTRLSNLLQFWEIKHAEGQTPGHVPNLLTASSHPQPSSVFTRKLLCLSREQLPKTASFLTMARQYFQNRQLAGPSHFPSQPIPMWVINPRPSHCLCLAQCELPACSVLP